MPTLLETVLSNSLAAALLAVLAFAVSRWRQPALAHALWLLVLVKLVTPPLIPVNVEAWNWEFGTEPPAQATAQLGEKTDSIPNRLEELSPGDIETLLAFSETATEPASPATSSPASQAAAAVNWQEWVVPLWLGGSLLGLGLTWRTIIRFQRLLRSARRAPVGLQNETKELASRLGLSRCPAVWVVPGAVSPMIWSIGAAPLLIFPAGLLERLGREQRAALLVHELAHVRRRDHWVRILELVLGALYWWHPLFWLARRELREAEEQCCDAWVVWASDGEGHVYSRALLEAVAFVSHTRCPLPAAASGIGYVSHLRRRLTMIMRGNTPRSLSALGWLLVLAVGFCLLPLAARAQTPAKPESGREEIKALKEKLKQLEVLRNQEEADDDVELVVTLLDDEDADVNANVADLKKLIAAKRAELNELEAKLMATLNKLDAKKAGKAKKEKTKGMPDPKTMIDLVKPTDVEIKRLTEEIQKTIRDNPGLKKLEELKKLDKLERLEELKKLGDLHIEFKGLDDLKKHAAELKSQERGHIEEMKKFKDKEQERAGASKGAVERGSKERIRKADDMDARLDRLMKEIEQIRKEIHESKERQGR